MFGKRKYLLLIIGIAFLTINWIVNSERISDGSLIRSDGAGYYAYLPAFLIYGDYESSYKAEAQIKGETPHSPPYLFKNQSGNLYNKYFPGVAFVQAPFFLMAYFISGISGLPIDGYSTIFQFFFWLGALFYFFLGMFFLVKTLKKIVGESDLLLWLPFFLISTPICFYILYGLSMSHSFSFSFVAIFAYLIVSINTEFKNYHWVLLGTIFGILLLIRPTNILFVFTVPFLKDDWSNFRSFCFLSLRNFQFWLIPLAIAFFLLFFIGYIQTGTWKIEKYPGEGFNWFSPKIFQVLFSFRSGIFIQFPVLIFGLFGLIKWYQVSRMAAVFFLIYFFIVTYVNAAWWCWDYESYYGNRSFTEHLLFFMLPMAFLFKEKVKWKFVILGFFSCISIIRLYTYDSGIMLVQRFTAENYFQSLLFWKTENKDRWNFTRSCEPYGVKMGSWVLYSSKGQISINNDTEFSCGGQIELPKRKTNRKLYYRAEMDKKLLNDEINDVFLVVDAISSNSDERYYYKVPLYIDRLEGKSEWKHLIFEGSILDNFQKFNQLSIYIWNPGKRNLLLKNVSVELMEYSSDKL